MLFLVNCSLRFVHREVNSVDTDVCTNIIAREKRVIIGDLFRHGILCPYLCVQGIGCFPSHLTDKLQPDVLVSYCYTF